ncbi:MAG: PAS domain S-box protein [Planctomycetes bacterium]|nr:PAS domain S-box protein [Planctomycetota bacterium]
MFDASPSGMLLVSAEGLVRLANREAERLFGFAHGELRGRSVEELVPERFRGGHPAQRNGYFAAPAARAMGAGRDLYGLRRDGTEVPIEIGLNPIRAGDRTYVLAAVIDITQRKRSEDLLRGSLAEKETLLREIHHRVKNNMQVVSSLLNLQQGSIDDARYRALFEECQTRVQTMALIHEKLYAAGNLAALDAADYLRSLTHMLLRTYLPSGSPVRVDQAFAPLRLSLQTAIPVGLILHELLTNAIKHAFPSRKAGTLRVTLTAHGEGARLEVADDGAGLPPEFEVHASRGLGFRLIAALVRQLDGALHVQRGGGTCFAIDFVPAATADTTT